MKWKIWREFVRESLDSKHFFCWIILIGNSGSFGSWEIISEEVIIHHENGHALCEFFSGFRWWNVFLSVILPDCHLKCFEEMIARAIAKLSGNVKISCRSGSLVHVHPFIYWVFMLNNKRIIANIFSRK